MEESKPKKKLKKARKKSKEKRQKVQEAKEQSLTGDELTQKTSHVVKRGETQRETWTNNTESSLRLKDELLFQRALEHKYTPNPTKVSGIDLCPNAAYLTMPCLIAPRRQREEASVKKVKRFVNFKSRDELRRQYRHRPPPKIPNLAVRIDDKERRFTDQLSVDTIPSETVHHTNPSAQKLLQTKMLPAGIQMRPPIIDLKGELCKELKHRSLLREKVKDDSFSREYVSSAEEQPTYINYPRPFRPSSRCLSTFDAVGSTGDYMRMLPKRKTGKQVSPVHEYQTWKILHK